MDLKVKCFDEKTAKDELKKCPEIVRDYFKLIMTSRDHWEEMCRKAISNLRNRTDV